MGKKRRHYEAGYEAGWRDGYSKGDEDGDRQGAEDFETNRRKGLANPERQGNGCMVYRSAK